MVNTGQKVEWRECTQGEYLFKRRT